MLNAGLFFVCLCFLTLIMGCSDTDPVATQNAEALTELDGRKVELLNSCHLVVQNPTEGMNWNTTPESLASSILQDVSKSKNYWRTRENNPNYNYEPNYNIPGYDHGPSVHHNLVLSAELFIEAHELWLTLQSKMHKTGGKYSVLESTEELLGSCRDKLGAMATKIYLAIELLEAGGYQRPLGEKKLEELTSTKRFFSNRLDFIREKR